MTFHFQNITLHPKVRLKATLWCKMHLVRLQESPNVNDSNIAQKSKSRLPWDSLLWDPLKKNQWQITFNIQWHPANIPVPRRDRAIVKKDCIILSLRCRETSIQSCAYMSCSWAGGVKTWATMGLASPTPSSVPFARHMSSSWSVSTHCLVCSFSWQPFQGPGTSTAA